MNLEIKPMKTNSTFQKIRYSLDEYKSQLVCYDYKNLSLLKTLRLKVKLFSTVSDFFAFHTPPPKHRKVAVIIRVKLIT